MRICAFPARAIIFDMRVIFIWVSHVLTLPNMGGRRFAVNTYASGFIRKVSKYYKVVFITGKSRTEAKRHVRQVLSGTQNSINENYFLLSSSDTVMNSGQTNWYLNSPDQWLRSLHRLYPQTFANVKHENMDYLIIDRYGNRASQQHNSRRIVVDEHGRSDGARATFKKLKELYEFIEYTHGYCGGISPSPEELFSFASALTSLSDSSALTSSGGGFQ